jgi:hypothetical protein
MRRDSAVDVATGYPRGRSSSPDRGKIYLQAGAHPDSYPIGSGVKWPGRKAHHWPPTSTEVKSIPPYVLMA